MTRPRHRTTATATASRDTDDVDETPPSDSEEEEEEEEEERSRGKRKRSFSSCFSFYNIVVALMVANGLAFLALSRQQQQQRETGHHRSLQQYARPRFERPQDTSYSLKDLKLLVAIAAYDYAQLPHLEHVLDGYHDTCIAGARVHVVIHTTVAWPVSFIDLLLTRFPCPNFSLEFVLKLTRVKLHLVDYHRKLFYDRLQDYDLFVYTEDDIRITPRVIATYWEETQKVARLVQGSGQYKPSDFNVGIVRYEYNFPSNVVIDDTTRKATENVTRVYWEHSSFKPPLVPNAVVSVPQEPLANNYVHMKNHHQGLYLATRDLLEAWKTRCEFHIASNRPGQPNKPSQPLFGTQRVWMSSQQLYGSRKGCGVQQVIPLDQFGALTVHHLPNKNYRRVGKYRTRDTNKDEGVVVDEEQLLTALQLHLALVKEFPPKPKKEVRLKMYYQPDNQYQAARSEPHWKERLERFEAYVKRGGVLSQEDLQQTSLW